MHEATLDHRLVITPLLDESQVGPASIDLRLGSSFIETRRRGAHVIDPSDAGSISSSISQDRYEVPTWRIPLYPPGSVPTWSDIRICSTSERPWWSGIRSEFLGKAWTYGRDGGNRAAWIWRVLRSPELQNLGSVPIRLFPGLRVAQLMVWQTSSTTKNPYPRHRPTFKLVLDQRFRERAGRKVK